MTLSTHRENDDPTHETERACGIELYANAAAGFSGILKERFSDFIVREIDRESGEGIHLTDTRPTCDRSIDEREREKFERAKADAEGTTSARPAKAEDDEGDDDDEEAETIDEMAMKEFEDLCGEEDAKRLREFLATPGVTSKSQKSLPPRAQLPQPLVLSATTDKEQRTKIHQFFKRHFLLPTDNVVESEKSEKEALKNLQKPASSVRVHPAEKKGTKRKGGPAQVKDHRQSFNFWPTGVPEYVRFMLCKENKESQEILNVIARALNVNYKALGVAGTKDKRAVTTQYVTLRRFRAKRLAKLVLYGCKIGNYSYVDKQLGFGDHLGNEFEITLRGISPEDVEKIGEAVRALDSSGTINYYGLQRFGSTEGKHATHKIGIELIRGQWQAAIDLLLMPREGERNDVAAARVKWEETKDPNETLKLFPRWCTAERAILERMTKVRVTDIVGPLLAVPKAIRMMYVHAYQAYMFNRVVSARIRKYGMNTVVEGDLVLEDDEFAGEDEEREEHEDNEDSSVTMPRVRIVSAEEAASGLIDPCRVVLPLPGHSVTYPPNMGDIYKQIAAQDGIELDVAPHSVREFMINAFTGDYRRCFLRPTKVSHRIVSYADPKADLVLTDLDRLNGVTERVIEEGPLRAVTIKFALPPSSYATMILRELMKSNTSVSAHKQKTLEASRANASST